MPETIDSLSINIASSSGSAVRNIDELTSSLKQLDFTTKNGFSGLASLSRQLDKIQKRLSSFQPSSLAQFNEISKSISALNGVKISSSISNQIKSIADSSILLNGVDFSGLETLSTSFEKITALPKSNLASTVNQLKKLPEVAKDLHSLDLDEFAADITKITTALAPLSEQLSKCSSGISNFTNSAKKLEQVSVGMSKQSSGFGFSTMSPLSFFIGYHAIKKGIDAVSNWITESNSYIESLNLFTASLGEYADEASRYANAVSEIMGIDPGQWMKNQGVFKTLITGFGVTSDRAYKMSKNLTQLGYDISSFFNISVDEAMQKLQSGISGELESLRRLGYDLSQARLEATALELGIKKTFNEMNQAEKSQLRYYSIMKQVTVVQGDMARTLNAPSNQLRILNAQTTQAARALGNIFIPALNAVLPYAIAAMKVIRELADEMARFFNFTLPEVDYSGIEIPATDALEDISDSFDTATEASEGFKGSLAGFDELNIIGSNNAVDGLGALGDSLSAGWTDFDLPEYDFLSDQLENRVNEIAEAMRREIPTIKKFGNILLLALAGSALLSGISKVTKFIQMLKSNAILKTSIGIALMFTGFGMEYDAFKNIGSGNAVIFDYIKGAIGAALGIAGSLIVFGTGPVGWIIGIAAAITVAIVGFAIGKREAWEAKVRQAFFNDVGKPISEIAEEFSESMSEITIKYNPIFEISDSVEQADQAVQQAATAIDILIYSLQDGSVVTKEQTEKIKEAFSDLYDSMEERLSSADQLIKTYIVTALQDAAVSAGVSVNSIMGELARITGENNARLHELRAMSDQLISELPGLTVGSEEYRSKIEQLGEYQREAMMLTNTMSEGSYAWQVLKEQFNEGFAIDFEDLDAAKEAIANMGEVAQAAKDTLEQAWRSVDAELLGKLEYAKEFAPEQVQYWEELRETLKKDFESQQSLIDKDLRDMYEQIGIQAADKYVSMAGAYDRNVDRLKVAEFIKSDILTPLTEEMRLSSGTIGDTAALSVMATFDKATDIMLLETRAAAKNYLDFLKNGKSAWEKVGDDLGNSIGRGIGGGMAAALLDVGTKISLWWDKFSLPVPKVSGGQSGPNYSDWTNVPIPKFASGGFPPVGDLFIANESGPEFVGSMDGRTVVANNSQLIAGVAQGVANGFEHGNREQNALLNEAVSLLRQLLNKESNVVFPTSAEAGRAVQRSLDMYGRARGY